MSIAAGRLAADSGEILRGGSPVSYRSAKGARRAGLVLVPQHDLLIGAASVADNLAFLDPAAPFFESADVAARPCRAARAGVRARARRCGRPRRRVARRDPPAHRDRGRARRRPGRPHPRRADGRPLPRRDGGPFRFPQETCRRRRRRRPHHPPARRGLRRRRPADAPRAGAVGQDLPRERDDTAGNRGPSAEEYRGSA